MTYGLHLLLFGINDVTSWLRSVVRTRNNDPLAPAICREGLGLE